MVELVASDEIELDKFCELELSYVRSPLGDSFVFSVEALVASFSAVSIPGSFSEIMHP